LTNLGQRDEPSAKQCIWNKAGFVLNIAWILNGQVVRTDQRALGQGVCANDGDGTNYTIILSVVGGELADLSTRLGITVVGTLIRVPGLGLAGLAIPNPKGVFYVGVPEQDRYLDVWGTIWNPQTGYGGRP